MDKQEFDLQVVTYAEDHQDGSGSVRLFNSLEELWAHINKYRYEGPLTEEEKQVYLDGENSYENGLIKTTSIKFTLENGKLSLAKTPYFATGSDQ